MGWAGHIERTYEVFIGNINEKRSRRWKDITTNRMHRYKKKRGTLNDWRRIYNGFCWTSREPARNSFMKRILSLSDIPDLNVA